MRTPQNLFGQWLELERSGTSEAAEQALQQLCGLLPQAVPRAGFAERVLARSAVVRRDLLAAFLERWWARPLVAMVAVQAAVLIAGVSRGFLTAIEANGPAGAANALINLVVAWGHLLNGFWSVLDDVAAARDVAASASAPAVIPVLVLLTAALIAGLLLFNRLASPVRRWRFGEAR